jgi:hypothetical protein
MSSILNSFLPKKWTSFLSDSQEEDSANTRRVRNVHFRQSCGGSRFILNLMIGRCSTAKLLLDHTPRRTLTTRPSTLTKYPHVCYWRGRRVTSKSRREKESFIDAPNERGAPTAWRLRVRMKVALQRRDRVLTDSRTPRDATFIQPPRSSPQRNMPPHVRMYWHL